MKKIFSVIFVSTILFFGLNVFLVSAHQSRTGLAAQMMGKRTFETMERMEEQMMGTQNHERMEELMDKLLVGDLSAAEEQEMIKFMQDVKMGPGAANMMMRTTASQMMEGRDNFGYGGMMGWGMMGGSGSLYWLSLLTVIVWLVVGVLLATWLFQKLTKKDS